MKVRSVVLSTLSGWLAVAGVGCGDTGGGCPAPEGYPVIYRPKPAADSSAMEGLRRIGEQFGSSPSGEWVADRGTFLWINRLDIPLPACRDTERVMDHLWPVLDAWPDVFQVDPGEWAPTIAYGSTECASIVGTSAELGFSVGRVSFGGRPFEGGSLVFYLTAEGDRVTLSRIFGNYISLPTESALQAMTGCASCDRRILQRAVQKERLPFVIFGGSGWCQIVGEGSYSFRPGDRIEWGEEFWVWDQEGRAGPVELMKYVTASLIVSPANYTAELLKSSAACPGSVGFRLTFDAVTGELLGSVPGIGCIVC